MTFEHTSTAMAPLILYNTECLQPACQVVDLARAGLAPEQRVRDRGLFAAPKTRRHENRTTESEDISSGIAYLIHANTKGISAPRKDMRLNFPRSVALSFCGASRPGTF